MVRIDAVSFHRETRFDGVSGINNFDNNIYLKDFQLPRDNPEGGIDFVAVTQLYNPRCVEIYLSSSYFL